MLDEDIYFLTYFKRLRYDRTSIPLIFHVGHILHARLDTQSRILHL